MGVASFVISLVSGVSGALMIVVVYVFFTTPGVVERMPLDDETPLNYLIGTWGFATGVLSLVGIVFGIGGVLQKGRRRSLAVSGLVLNIALPIGLMFIIVLGVAMEGRPPTQPGGRAVAAARSQPARNASRAAIPSRRQPESDANDSWSRLGVRAFGVALAVTAYLARRQRWFQGAPAIASPTFVPPPPALPAMPPALATAAATDFAIPGSASRRTTECARCAKAVPSEATYCTRCGHVMSSTSPLLPPSLSRRTSPQIEASHAHL